MRPPGTPQQLQRRREYAMQLLKLGKTLSAVARAVSASPSSVWRWQHAYQQQGWRGLQARPIPGRPSCLSPAEKQTLAWVLLQGPLAAGYKTDLWTLKRISKLIKHLFAVTYHPGHVWKMLRGLGWSCQKPERRALQRDEEAIAHWKRYYWPKIKKRLIPAGRTWFSWTKAAFCSFPMSNVRGLRRARLRPCTIC
jgi:transposase